MKFQISMLILVINWFKICILYLILLTFSYRKSKANLKLMPKMSIFFNSQCGQNSFKIVVFFMHLEFQQMFFKPISLWQTKSKWHIPLRRHIDFCTTYYNFNIINLTYPTLVTLVFYWPMMCESVPFSREKQTGNVFILGDNSIFRREDSQREVAFATTEPT